MEEFTDFSHWIYEARSAQEENRIVYMRPDILMQLAQEHTRLRLLARKHFDDTAEALTFQGLVVKALAHIHYKAKPDFMGHVHRDVSMKNIAQVTRDLGKLQHVNVNPHPRVISRTLAQDLGLPRRKLCPTTRRTVVDYTEAELRNLMTIHEIEEPTQ